jgi:serine/threonine protein kinase
MKDEILTDARVGTHIGDYQIDGILGEGGMGKVYRATAGDGSVVALKLVKEDCAADQTFRRRFDRESRIAQTVKHPNVVPMLASGEHEGLPYMAQRFVDGLALDAKIRQDGTLDVATAVQIGADIAAGLMALWAAGVVHRDIKPANILLDASQRAYITDFGLAKDTKGSILTLPGQALGSMDYMAPEQIRGEPVSGASDVYALGCVMYECLCGKPPFAHVRGMRILWAHLQEQPPDPRGVRPDLPPELARTLLLALEKEPDKRPESPAEYIRLLAEVAGVTIGSS